MTVTSPKTWYIVQAQSGFEKKVEDHLREQIKLHALEDHICEIFVPLTNVRERTASGYKDVVRNIFPGYVLVQLANKPHVRINSRVLSVVRNSPKVIDFLNNNNQPMPISEEEAQAMRDKALEDGSGMRDIDIPFNIGDQVRVIEGPFASFSGFVEDIDGDKQRVKVAVTIFGRATPVDLEFTQVEKS